MVVIAVLIPAGQLPIGNDDNASRFVEQHDRVVKVHQLFVGQPCVHHIVYDDQGTAEPVFVFLHLFVDMVFGFQGIKKALHGIVADLDICRDGLSSKMAGEGCFPGAAFADDEQVLVIINPAQLFQLLNLPFDAAVEFGR